MFMVVGCYSPGDIAIEEVEVVVVNTDVKVDWDTLGISSLRIVAWGKNFGFKYPHCSDS